MSTFKNEENMEKVEIMYMYLQHEWVYETRYLSYIYKSLII